MGQAGASFEFTRGSFGHAATGKSPPENYGKEDQTTVAAFLPWRDLSVLNP